MSYATLAARLDRTARRLRENDSRLEGTRLAAGAAKVESALEKLDSLLDAALKGFDPAAIALRDLLESDAARSSLDARSLKLLAKKAMGKGLTLKATDTAADGRRKLLDMALKANSVDATDAALRALLQAAVAPPPNPRDRAAVLAEVWKLGRLSGPDLDLVKDRLLRDEPLLRVMAEHTYITTTARTKPASLFTALLRFARRVNENVS